MRLFEIEEILKDYFEEFKVLRTCGFVMLILEKGNLTIFFSSLLVKNDCLYLEYKHIGTDNTEIILMKNKRI